MKEFRTKNFKNLLNLIMGLKILILNLKNVILNEKNIYDQKIILDLNNK